MSEENKNRIAVIGAGISGRTALVEIARIKSQRTNNLPLPIELTDANGTVVGISKLHDLEEIIRQGVFDDLVATIEAKNKTAHELGGLDTEELKEVLDLEKLRKQMRMPNRRISKNRNAPTNNKPKVRKKNKIANKSRKANRK